MIICQERLRALTKTSLETAQQTCDWACFWSRLYLLFRRYCCHHTLPPIHSQHHLLAGRIHQTRNSDELGMKRESLPLITPQNPKPSRRFSWRKAWGPNSVSVSSSPGGLLPFMCLSPHPAPGGHWWPFYPRTQGVTSTDPSFGSVNPAGTSRTCHMPRENKTDTNTTLKRISNPVYIFQVSCTWRHFHQDQQIFFCPFPHFLQYPYDTMVSPNGLLRYADNLSIPSMQCSLHRWICRPFVLAMLITATSFWWLQFCSNFAQV